MKVEGNIENAKMTLTHKAIENNKADLHGFGRMN